MLLKQAFFALTVSFKEVNGMSEVVKTYLSYSSVKRHGIKCEINTPSGSYPLHRHDYFEFEIIKSGSVAHELNGMREILEVGEVIALSPNDLHRFTFIEPVEICNFCVYRKDAPQAVEKLLSSMKFPLRGRFSGDALERIIDYYTKVSNTIKTGVRFERELVTAYTILFLTDIFCVSKSITAECTANGYTHVARAMEFIGANLSSHISLGDVASSVHLAPSYFSKLFAKITGKSFVHYLTEQRVEYARLLLTSTDDSITRIAFASGFGSFSAFSRAFRSYLGSSPYEFRKNARSGKGKVAEH